MSYRTYQPPAPLLFGYDPFRDLPADHLARLIEFVVEETVAPPVPPVLRGAPAYDPRLCLKVLLYGYATGTRSSRHLERLCDENLAYLFLTRGDTPSHMTLCRFRGEQLALLEQVWDALFAVADGLGIQRVGHLVVDSTKLRADVSPEAILKAAEFSDVRTELERILAEAQRIDEREGQEGAPGATRTGQPLEPETMRSILRRVRGARAAARRKRATGIRAEAEGTNEAAVSRSSETIPANRTAPSPQMLRRVEAAREAVQAAEAAGAKHLALTDPDAPMMAGGREQRIRPCHSLEVAVDRADGLLVVGGALQTGNDNARLEPIVAAAQRHEPEGVRAVDGDSGYYEGGAIGRLEAAGIETCVPDSQTACDLHRGQPIGTTRSRWVSTVAMTYEADTDSYRCPEGNRLLVSQQRHEKGKEVTVYVAERPCTGCPLASACIRGKGKRRHLNVGASDALLARARERFADPAHRQRYRHRGEVVETVFGFLRGTLGYVRWSLRGKKKVACEGRLMTLAYQLRKLSRRWCPLPT